MNDIAVDFAWTPSAPAPGQGVSFAASASPGAGVSIKSYSWDFDGDGLADKEGKSATWTYSAPGTVTVSLLVRGNGNHRGQAAHKVTIAAPVPGAPKPPVASFSISPSRPVANEPVLFTSTSADPDGAISEVVWDLNGDGSYDNGGGATARRSFPAPGRYVVGLRVTDNAGLVSFDSETITVSPATRTLAARPLSPFPVVRIVGRITKRGTRVRLLRVSAPVGAKVSVRCAGKSCPFEKQVRAVTAGARSPTAVAVRVRRLERLLLPGVQVRVYVTKRGTIGKYTRIRFRDRRAPLRIDRCLMPGKWTPSECPSS